METFTSKGGGIGVEILDTPLFPRTCMLAPPPANLMPIFEDGKLKPGTYKVQNLKSQTYLEILEDTKDLCCRPREVLSGQDALVTSTHPTQLSNFRCIHYISQWEFQTSGSGYRIKKASGATRSVKLVVAG